MNNIVTVCVSLDKSFWVAMFERKIGKEVAVAKHIFGAEPTNPEVYEFILQHYSDLHFRKPVTLDQLTVKIKRVNPKRMKREARKLFEKSEKIFSHADELMRKSIEENKKIKKTLSSEEKAQANQEKFSLKQKKKKEKQKGGNPPINQRYL